MNVNSLALLFIDPEAWLAATAWCVACGLAVLALLRVLQAIAETDAANIIVATVACAITGTAVWGAVCTPTICGIVVVASGVATIIATIAFSAWHETAQRTRRR